VHLKLLLGLGLRYWVDEEMINKGSLTINKDNAAYTEGSMLSFSVRIGTYSGKGDRTEWSVVALTSQQQGRNKILTGS